MHTTGRQCTKQRIGALAVGVLALITLGAVLRLPVLLAQPATIWAQAPQQPWNANSQFSPLVSAVPALTPTPTCSPAWLLVSSPNPSSTDSTLTAVTVVSPNDLWAVGSSNLSTGGTST